MATNCSLAYAISGEVGAADIAEAYRHALPNFDAISSRIEVDGANSLWRHDPVVEALVDVIDFGDTDGAFEAAMSRVTALAAEPFDPTGNVSGRVSILRAGRNRLIVVEAFNHLVADGHSIHLLHEAVERFLSGQTSDVPATRLYDELQRLSRAPLRANEGFWKQEFEGYDRRRSSRLGARRNAATVKRSWSASDMMAIRKAAARGGVTVASAMFAAHMHALARHSGSGDVASFVAIDARPPQLGHLFGQMTSVIPIRVQHAWHAPLSSHVKQVFRKFLVVRDHLHTDRETLDKCGAPISLGSPDAAVFIFQDRPSMPPRVPECRTELVKVPDLHYGGGYVVVLRCEQDGSVNLNARAPASSDFASLLDSIVESIFCFLNALVHQPSILLGDDSLLPLSSRELVDVLGRPSQPYQETSLEGKILRSLRRDRVVVLEHGESYTAHALRQSVARKVRALRRAGVGRGMAVLVEDQGTFERIGSFLAVLALRATYVPIDLTASGPDKSNLARRFPIVATINSNHVCVENSSEIQQVSATMDDPAYVIFTSGTTGPAKGVVISRQALGNLAAGELERFDIGSSSRVLLIAPPISDPWICHVAGTLLAGATLVHVDPLSEEDLGRTINTLGVTHAFLPAALVTQLSGQQFPELQVLASAGDHCRLEHVMPFIERGHRVFNIYGPTETTVTATVAELLLTTRAPSIGRPIRGLGARVLIDGVASAPIGVTGELHIGGVGVALGYLDDPKETSAKFRQNLLGNERIYATGDLAFLGPDGNFYVKGRIDRQIKIRGFRVDLGQIESIARSTGLCSDAHASAVPSSLAYGTTYHRFVLFVEGCPRPGDLNARLQRELAPHMRPQIVIPLSALPRGESGKIDSKMLPPTFLKSSAPAGDVTDNTGVSTLTRIWTRVLEIEPKSTDNFFSLGGDSLGVLRLVREARSVGFAIAPQDVYRHPTLSAMAANIHSRELASFSVSSDRLTTPLNISQRWFFALNPPREDHWNQQHTVYFENLPPTADIERSIDRLLQEIPCLSSQVTRSGLTISNLASRTTRLITVEEPSDEDIGRVLKHLHGRMLPEKGQMFNGAIVRLRSGRGCLILVAHHLIIDDWSWHALEDRLREILDGTIPRPRDMGFRKYMDALLQQDAAGAFNLDVPAWYQILNSGRTVEFDERSQTTVKLTSTSSARISTLPARTGMPASAIALACIAAGLQAIEPFSFSVVDIERNGRSIFAQIDISDAVGWFTLHHPVCIEHREFSESACLKIAKDIERIPDAGIGYGILRWLRQHDGFGSRVGRFAVSISESATANQTVQELSTLATRIGHVRSHKMKRHVSLPYEATFDFRPTPSGTSIELTYDIDRISASAAARLVAATAHALEQCRSTIETRGSQPLRQAPATSGHFSGPFAISSMQALMFATSEMRRDSTVYLPQQLVQVSIQKSAVAAFLAKLSFFLGTLEPFRVRIRRQSGRTEQYILDPSPVSIEKHVGGEAEALIWLTEHRKWASSIVAAGRPYRVASFEQENEPLRIGMQFHHAVIDGESNRLMLRWIEQLSAGEVPSVPSTAALRKHVSADVTAQLKNITPPPSPQEHVVSTGQRTSIRFEMDRRLITRLGDAAEHHALDLRAIFCGAALVLSNCKPEAEISGPLYIVTNGRDPQIPETEMALGLFWYFRPILPESTDVIAESKRVFEISGDPIALHRSAAANWAEWLTGDGWSINFLKDTSAVLHPTINTSVQSISDIFHFNTQIQITLRNTQTCAVIVQSFKKEEASLRRLMACYIRILRSIPRTC